MKVKYRHFRIPEDRGDSLWPHNPVGESKKGVYRHMSATPNLYSLHRYSRSYGWPPKSYAKGGPTQRGGATLCTIEVDGESFTGLSLCTLLDNFNYKLGRVIAFNRAMKLMNGGEVKFKTSRGIDHHEWVAALVSIDESGWPFPIPPEEDYS